MAKGKKQKLNLFYLYKIMRDETKMTHLLAMIQVIEKLNSYDREAVQSSQFISEKETKVLLRKQLDLVIETDARLSERDIHVPGRIKNMAKNRLRCGRCYFSCAGT